MKKAQSNVTAKYGRIAYRCFEDFEIQNTFEKMGSADEVRSSRLRVTLKAQAFSFVSTLCLLRWVACLLFMLICALSDEALHKTLNAVFQDFVPYSLTVRENVATGDIEKLHNDQALQSALERAHAADFINSLDMPLGKMTEDGVDLSGGQWQRIAIARALISGSPFIILDEPAASLDPVAESALYNDLIALMSKQGCLIISHRLASAKQADKIAVIDRGRLVESGPHEQLLEKTADTPVCILRRVSGPDSCVWIIRMTE